jgi:hypothetical protein
LLRLPIFSSQIVAYNINNLAHQAIMSLRAEWEPYQKDLRNFNKDHKFDGKAIHFAAFCDYLAAQFEYAKLQELSLPVNERPIPPASFPPQNRNVLTHPLNVEEMTYQIALDKRRREVINLYTMGTGIVINHLGSKAYQEVAELHRSNNPAPAKFNLIMAQLNQIYQTDSEATIQALICRLDSVPEAKTTDEAKVLCMVISQTDLTIRFYEPQNIMSESMKRLHLMKHLDHLVFANLLANMKVQPNSPAYTFDQCRMEIDHMQDTERVKELHAQKETLVATATPEPGATAPLVATSIAAVWCKEGKTDVCLKHHPHHPMDCPETRGRKRKSSFPPRDPYFQQRPGADPRRRRPDAPPPRSNPSSRQGKSSSQHNVYDRVYQRNQGPYMNARGRQVYMASAAEEHEEEEVDEEEDFSYLSEYTREDYDAEWDDFDEHDAYGCHMVKAVQCWTDDFLEAQCRVAEWHSQLTAQEHGHIARRNALRSSCIHQDLFKAEHWGSRYVTRLHSLYHRRPYLAKSCTYRSSRRGRGRGYQPPMVDGVKLVLPVSSSVEVEEPATVYTKLLFSLSAVSTLDTLSPGVMASCSQIMANTAEAVALTTAMFDSGANLSISNPHLACMLGVVPTNWPTPIPIQFGNASSAVSTQYIDLGPLVGRIALVDSATTTILAKKVLHRQGLSVLFRHDLVCQILCKDTVMYETTLDSPDSFFMIPLNQLLPPPLRRHLEDYLSQSKKVNARKALPSVTEAEIKEVMELHERMFHPSSATMARALRAGAWPGVEIVPTLVERVFQRQDCLYCALGKMKKIPRPPGSAVTPLFGAEISIDYLPVTTKARGGHTGAYMIVERATGYAWAHLTSKHDHKQCYKAITHARLSLRRYGHILKQVRTDAGGIEGSEPLAILLSQDELVINAASPASQFQNFVERFVQTAIRGIATTLLAQRYLDNSFWGMALLAWVHAWNCRPNSNSGDYSPHFHLTNHHPVVNVQFRFPFGTAVSSKKPVSVSRLKTSLPKTFKFAPTGDLGFVVGSTGAQNGSSLVYFPKKGNNVAFSRIDLQRIHTGATPHTATEIERMLQTMTISKDAIVLPVTIPVPIAPPSTTEFLFPAHTSDSTDAPVAFSEFECAAIPSPVEATVEGSASEGVEEAAESEGAEQSASEGVEVVDQVADSEVEADAGPMEVDNSPPTQLPVCGSEHRMQTRSSTRVSQVVGSKRAHEGSPPSFSVAQAKRSTGQLNPDMPTLAHALRSDSADKWIESIRKELEALKEHNTGTEVSRQDIPRTAQVLPVKVVLKIKRDSQGVEIKHKARLCVLGNLRRKTLSSVFSPTANDKSLQLLLAIATARRLRVIALDVYGAFLYPDQKDDIYVAIPPTITGGRPVFLEAEQDHVRHRLEPQGFL